MSILANPRYTGRQVWNRQYTDHEPADHSAGRDRPVLRWNNAHDWVISTDPAHVGLVSEADFVAVQRVRAARPSSDGAAHLPVGRAAALRHLRPADASPLDQQPDSAVATAAPAHDQLADNR